tara:strand:+ start:47442 stop:48365 length:924 start_codon:yes stop_codon:yes gene_type:complete
MSLQYNKLGQRILAEGEFTFNDRTGKNCLTLIDHDLTYNVGAGEFPIDTTRESNWEGAVAELLGYLRGLDDASLFKALGTGTWLKNAASPTWVKSKFRKLVYQLIPGNQDKEPPETYMGRPYGKQLRSWIIPDRFVPKDEVSPRQTIDQLRKVYNNLKMGIDDRGEILMMWNPGEHHLGCLRPCMYGYQFSLLNGTLHLHATQRSCDVPLGLNYNMVQCYAFLAIMARITGHKPGKVFHKLVNAHVYEDQLENFKVHMARKPDDQKPQFILPDEMKTLEDIETWVTPEHFAVTGYKPQGPIKYKFSA